MPRYPLHLINIGGGPAIDVLNVLILLNHSHADLLTRKITIQVLDIDSNGPQFGAAALRALCTNGEALAGLDVALSHDIYDWNKPAQIGDLLREASSRRALTAASSEGALFEYGTDDAIVANLKVLHSHGVKTDRGFGDAR